MAFVLVEAATAWVPATALPVLLPMVAASDLIPSRLVLISPPAA